MILYVSREFDPFACGGGRVIGYYTGEGVSRAATTAKLPPGGPLGLLSGSYPRQCPDYRLRLLLPASRWGG